MARTTILLPDDLLLEVRKVAESRATTVTEVIRTALTEYVEGQPAAMLPSFAGVVDSGTGGRGKLGRNAKQAARRAIDPTEGSARKGKR
jgi:predicted transcriptional regulator